MARWLNTTTSRLGNSRLSSSAVSAVCRSPPSPTPGDAWGSKQCARPARPTNIKVSWARLHRQATIAARARDGETAETQRRQPTALTSPTVAGAPHAGNNCARSRCHQLIRRYVNTNRTSTARVSGRHTSYGTHGRYHHRPTSTVRPSNDRRRWCPPPKGRGPPPLPALHPPRQSFINRYAWQPFYDVRAVNAVPPLHVS